MHQQREDVDDGRLTRMGCVAGFVVAVLLPLWGFVFYLVSAVFS